MGTLTALSLFKAVAAALFQAAGIRKLTPQILIMAFKKRASEAFLAVAALSLFKASLFKESFF